MHSPLTYQVSLVQIDYLRRQAAAEQQAATLRPPPPSRPVRGRFSRRRRGPGRFTAQTQA